LIFIIEIIYCGFLSSLHWFWVKRYIVNSFAQETRCFNSNALKNCSFFQARDIFNRSDLSTTKNGICFSDLWICNPVRIGIMYVFREPHLSKMLAPDFL